MGKADGARLGTCTGVIMTYCDTDGVHGGTSRRPGGGVRYRSMSMCWDPEGH